MVQRFVALVVALVLAGAASAQEYPTKPVQIITPAAAGNSPDVATRLVADKLAAIWKQQIVILNRPGAGGLIAAQAAAAAPNDGYTLYMAQASTFTVLPMTQEKMPVDLEAAFVPIGLVGEQPIAVSVTPALGVNNVPELIALIRKTQGGMLFAATNRGGQSHLTGELFARRANVPLTYVHAPSASQSITDVTAGRIPIIFEGVAGVGGAAAGGLIKLLAVGSVKRLPNYPDIPTIGESVPGFESKGWLLLMAPAGTPNFIVERINADLRTVLNEPEVQNKFATIGTYPRYLSPAQSAEFIKKEQDLWWPLVKEVGVQR